MLLVIKSNLVESGGSDVNLIEPIDALIKSQVSLEALIINFTFLNNYR